MLPNEQPPADEGKQPRRRFNWDLYYYEKHGDRLFFRITPFAIILMIIAALGGITIIIMDLRKNPSRETNINVTVPPAASDSPNSSIIQASPSPKAAKRPAVGSPPPASSNVNAGNGAAPRGTPVSESPPGR